MITINYSFDIYDTCFIRNIAYPFGKDEVVEVARLRVNAEKEAQETSVKEDISFDDIYQNLNLAWWGISKAAMMELELQLEFSSIRPILATK